MSLHKNDVINKKFAFKLLKQSIPLILIFLGMFGSFKIFEHYNAIGIEKQNEAYLIECTTNLQERLDTDIQNYTDTINSISFLYSELINNIEEGAIVLGEIEKKTEFDEIYFVSKYDGKVYSSYGEVISITGEDVNATTSEYFTDAMSGHHGIGVLYPSKLTGKREIGFYAPVVQNKEIIGVLVGCLEESTIKKKLATYFYGTLADTVLVSESMKIVGVSSRISIYDYIDENDDPYDFNSILKIQLSDQHYANIVLNALRERKNAPFRYKISLGECLGYVKKLENADWMIIQTYPADAMQLFTKNANKSGKILEILLSTIFILYIIYLISTDLHQSKIIKKQLIEQTKRALMDDLTDVFNRRAYEEDIEEFKNDALPNELALIEIDINGLKVANDSNGHKAGDELIIATAKCIKSVFEESGKIYRLGGDEFAIFITAAKDEVNKKITALKEDAKNWKGKFNSDLSFSIGTAFISDYPDKTIDEIKTIADMHMYEDKNLYYSTSGKDRRIH